MPNPNKLFNIILIILILSIVILSVSFGLIFNSLLIKDTEPKEVELEEQVDSDPMSDDLILYNYNGTEPVGFMVELDAEYNMYYEGYNVYTFHDLADGEATVELATISFVPVSDLAAEATPDDSLELYILQKYSTTECGPIESPKVETINEREVTYGAHTKECMVDNIDAYYVTRISDEHMLVITGKPVIGLGILETFKLQSEAL